MRIEGHFPVKSFVYESPVGDMKTALRDFRSKHPGAVIETIDDREVVGMCEGCELPIFEGELYGRDDDGVRYHEKCGK